VRVWIGSIWLRTESSRGFREHNNETSGSRKKG